MSVFQIHPTAIGLTNVADHRTTFDRILLN
ncbi:Uncharacterised protein [Vibrio cholerae]|nr:Uncharacterised protein [Vibrio cholerae]